MFQSLIRGFKMILASIELGLKDPRIMIPSFLMVFMNFVYTAIIIVQFKLKVNPVASGVSSNFHKITPNSFHHGQSLHMVSQTAVSGAFENFNTNFVGQYFNPQDCMIYLSIIAIWWLTNIILEGITTAMVYTNLTDGPGKASFGLALQGVLQSLSALIVLGLVTVVAKRLVGWMRHHRGSGVLGFGIDFLAGIVEVFWTMAGHLILPAIIIEGNSFWDAMKRADQIAQGNIITIGFGEVEVEGLCKIMNFFVLLMASISALSMYFNHAQIQSIMFIGSVIMWACLVVSSAAMTIYLRCAFYACLYVWAIEAESVSSGDRSTIRPPAPLAQALI